MTIDGANERNSTHSGRANLDRPFVQRADAGRDRAEVVLRSCQSNENAMIQETELLERVTVRPEIVGGKPIIRGVRFAVEHVLANLAAGDTVDTILSQYPILDPEDIRACLLYAYRAVASEHVYDHG